MFLLWIVIVLSQRTSGTCIWNLLAYWWSTFLWKRKPLCYQKLSYLNSHLGSLKHRHLSSWRQYEWLRAESGAEYPGLNTFTYFTILGIQCKTFCASVSSAQKWGQWCNLLYRVGVVINSLQCMSSIQNSSCHTVSAAWGSEKITWGNTEYPQV